MSASVRLKPFARCRPRPSVGDGCAQWRGLPDGRCKGEQCDSQEILWPSIRHHPAAHWGALWRQPRRRGGGQGGVGQGRDSSSGQSNTGGGGGGGGGAGGNPDDSNAGSSGGSGYVAIRYKYQ